MSIKNYEKGINEESMELCIELLFCMFKDNSYIEENLHGAWYNRKSNKGNEQR